jgi:hypothetical protein
VTSGPSGYALLDGVVAEAIGRGGRHDPVLPRSGGPAGNARLTAWTGVLLLAVIIAELVTLLDVTGLIGWHVGIGIVMVALTLMKSASTGWRIVRYYTGQAAYVRAGPPPTLLRLLGPLVVFTTLGVLGSGIALIAIGEEQSQQSLFALLGQQVSPITIHQAFFVLFAVCTGLHLLARFVPAVFLMSGRTQRVASRAAYRVDGVGPQCSPPRFWLRRWPWCWCYPCTAGTTTSTASGSSTSTAFDSRRLDRVARGPALADDLPGESRCEGVDALAGEVCVTADSPTRFAGRSPGRDSGRSSLRPRPCVQHAGSRLPHWTSAEWGRGFPEGSPEGCPEQGPCPPGL